MNKIDQMCEEAKRKLKHSVHTKAGIHKKAVAKGFADCRKRLEQAHDSVTR